MQLILGNVKKSFISDTDVNGQRHFYDKTCQDRQSNIWLLQTGSSVGAWNGA